jgi:DNA-binding HxlR family transcriptional regulator
MEPPESDELIQPQAKEAAGTARGVDPQAVVEEHLSLLVDAPHIDNTPPELNEAVGDLLEILSNAHALAILYHLFCERRPLRFSELEAALNATPKVLSRRLSELVDAGLVSRTSYDEIPPRVEYEPTAKADALDPAFQFLYAWAARYGVESPTE